MVPSGPGVVVLVPFPFSDLSETKLRPAVVLARAGRGDWILCQVTSNAYGDPQAIRLPPEDFQVGGLRIVSYARPSKLFTANESLFRRSAGELTASGSLKIRKAVRRLFE